MVLLLLSSFQVLTLILIYVGFVVVVPIVVVVAIAFFASDVVAVLMADVGVIVAVVCI